MNFRQSKSTVSARDEQWEVVNPPRPVRHGHDHLWQLVTLRSSRGRYSPGMKCTGCSLVTRITEEQWAAHGQRVERSKQS